VGLEDGLQQLQGHRDADHSETHRRLLRRNIPGANVIKLFLRS